MNTADQKKLNEFKVNFNDVELTPEQAEQLSKKMQSTALTQVAEWDLLKTNDFRIKLPTRWYGMEFGAFRSNNLFNLEILTDPSTPENPYNTAGVVHNYITTRVMNFIREKLMAEDANFTTAGYNFEYVSEQVFHVANKAMEEYCPNPNWKPLDFPFWFSIASRLAKPGTHIDFESEIKNSHLSINAKEFLLTKAGTVFAFPPKNIAEVNKKLMELNKMQIAFQNTPLTKDEVLNAAVSVFSYSLWSAAQDNEIAALNWPVVAGDCIAIILLSETGPAAIAGAAGVSSMIKNSQ